MNMYILIDIYEYMYIIINIFRLEYIQLISTNTYYLCQCSCALISYPLFLNAFVKELPKDPIAPIIIAFFFSFDPELFVVEALLRMR